VQGDVKDVKFYPFAGESDTTATTKSGGRGGRGGRGGPLRSIKAFLTVVLVILSKVILRVKMFFVGIFTGLMNMINVLINATPAGRALSRSKFGAFLGKLGSVLKQASCKRAFWANLAVMFALSVGLSKYKAFSRSNTVELAYSTFMGLVAADPEKIKHIRVTPQAFYYKINGKAGFTRKVNLDSSIVSKFMDAGIDFSAPPPPPNVLGLLWVLIYGAFMWNVTTKMMQGPQDSGVGVRRDQQLAQKQLSFDDIAGQERAKQEVSEVCTMLRSPQRYQAVGARLPAGVLLIGPPGTGKTLLARVTAAEAGVPFYACSASDFVEVFVGRGPARVRKLFAKAATTAPCIVFIDELDSIGRSRQSGSMNSEQENTLNAILTCMDGLDTSNNGVIVMAATNRLELLDPALLRAGRFDRIVQCPLPDKDGREAILRVATKKYVLSADVDLDKIARLTPATSGADLAAIANEAAIRAARRGAITINQMDFNGGLDYFMAGRNAQVSSLIDSVTPNWLKGIQPGAMAA
jgi:cell division protease FtsH